MTTTTESENVMPVITVQISAAVLDDHQGRLYHGEQHMDVAGATIREVARTKKVATVEMTEAALEEWLDDLDYSIEFCEVPSQKAQYRRALATLKEAK